MASVNKCIFIGNLTRDPEVRYMTSGKAVANCSIACNEQWKDKNGDKQEKVEFINLVFYRRLAEVAGEYLKKGSQVYIEGKLTTEKWQDKEGKDRYTTKIIVNEMTMLGGKPEGDANPSGYVPPAAREKASPAKTTTAAKGSFDNFDDDQIPF